MHEEKITEIAKMDSSTLLNPDAPLFLALQNDPPKWWQMLTEDPEIYIEIRKDNVIHVYYYGARIAEIDYKSHSFSAKCHTKYIYGDDASGDEYESCIHLLENTRGLKKLKKNALKFYVKDVEDEDTSEKRIQGRIRIDNVFRYVDSEFAHVFTRGESNNLIRFDLVAVEGNELKIEELKKIGDSRMRTSDMVLNPPEFLSQMKRYTAFMEVNKDELCTYYQKLLKIKSKLGLPIPLDYDVKKPLVLDLTPVLLIKNLYKYAKMGKDRYERIKDIRRFLEENRIKYYFLP